MDVQGTFMRDATADERREGAERLKQIFEHINWLFARNRPEDMDPGFKLMLAGEAWLMSDRAVLPSSIRDKVDDSIENLGQLVGLAALAADITVKEMLQSDSTATPQA